MKEFLDNLYKQCVSSRDCGVDEIFRVVGPLLGEHKFQSVDSIMRDMDLSRVDTGTMYALINLTSPYIYQLPSYRPTYQKIREEFARRGKDSEEIEDLFERFRDGWKERPFDPNALPNKTWQENNEDKFKAVMSKAEKIGDKDIIDYLNYYKSYTLRNEEREHKFHNLERTMGEEEMRRRTIKALREMADKLESTTSSWPGIYYCDLPEDPLLKGTFIDGIEVIISYPWPG